VTHEVELMMPSPMKSLSMGFAGLTNDDTWTDGLPICPLSGKGYYEMLFYHLSIRNSNSKLLNKF